MNKRLYLSLITILFLTYCPTVYGQTANDHMFPAAMAAKPYIDFDSKGFLIKGKRTFIVSAGLEYARVPHQLWYDRLLRIKRAGFNCVEVYTFWNFHEPKEHEFDFTGDHDLGAFLALVKKMGMYAIVRVGPYYCAEWDNGGYPIWLKFKEGLRVREDNKVFEQYVDRFFDKLLPIVFKNQINNGGAVILVQLENEHTKGWGTIMPDNYFKHLQAKALSLGLQVPYFFSGLHHSSDPASDGKSDDPSRPNPWFSTEFWSVWYSQYGAKPQDAGVYDRRTWKIIAQGGNGYNYYMAYGGTNFGYTNNDEDAASYDYGAAIGQAGDLRPIYYAFKRAALFARSFQEILENSTDATITYRKTIKDTALKVSARTSGAGDIIFLDNPATKPLTTRLAENSVPVTVDPGEIFPLVHNFKISSEVTLNWAYTRVFAVAKQQNTTTIIADCRTGQNISLHFIAKKGEKIKVASPDIKVGDGKIDIDVIMPESDKPREYLFSVGVQTVRVLAMNRKWTDRTWIADEGGKCYILSGADYAGDVSIKDHKLSVDGETPLLAVNHTPVWLYTDKSKFLLDMGDTHTVRQPAKPPQLKWERKSATQPAMATFNAGHWLYSKAPLQMGADGDLTADAWYRANLSIPVSDKYTIQVKGNGRGQAFVDGTRAAQWNLDDGEVSLNLTKGSHTLAIFTAHDGRNKLAGYIGPIANIDSKGIFGDVRIKQGGPFISELHNWYFVKASRRDDVRHGPPKFDTIVYKKYKIGTDAFNLKEGYGWFETLIDKLPAGTSPITLSFKSVDENATVFINGKEVSQHDGWNEPFEVTVSDPEVLKGPIRVSLFIENYSNEGGIDQPVKINTIGNARAVTDWRMKGGAGDLKETKGWYAISSNSKSTAGPCFYRTKFQVHLVKGETFIWRIDPKKMGHGSVWVNGHNLGRYPEKINAPGLYIPECWLRNGPNDLLIYDEDGRLPAEAAITAEREASRTSVRLTTTIK